MEWLRAPGGIFRVRGMSSRSREGFELTQNKKNGGGRNLFVDLPERSCRRY